MPVIRNPFRKNVPPMVLGSEPVVAQPSSRNKSIENLNRPDTLLTKNKINAGSIGNEDHNNTYKMSVVNDSGVYLPPSPTADKKVFWKRSESSHSSKNRPLVSPCNEPFTIPRESFDSYRRSFDISARSPIADSKPGRASMDSRPAMRNSLDIRPTRISPDSTAANRMSLDSTSLRTLPVEKIEEKEFEDVKLTDEPQIRPSRLNIFHRFGEHGPKDHSTPFSRNSIFGRNSHATESLNESELKSIQQGNRE